MLVLSRRDVLDLLTLRDCIEAVEGAFRLHAEGRTLGPGVLGVPAEDGGFHIKAAGLVGERRYFAAKTTANFPDNPRRFGRPAIQGTVVPGTFIAAVGADSQGKQELAPELVASATLVVDVLAQCAEIGELQHALAAGLMRREDVHAELADVVAGRRPGRTRDDEITVFDSSGTALQDVAAAIAVYEKARLTGRGTEVKLDD
jgi:ornithine cyclodeaminase/alanine dehydrogenase-like protein (mu-crystallin family)